MYTQHPILTEKHSIVDIFADLLKKKIYIYLFLFCLVSRSLYVNMGSTAKQCIRWKYASITVVFKYAKDAGKPKNLGKLDDFSEEQQAV